MSTTVVWLDPRTNPCPYCGGEVRRIDSGQIYGRSYGWMWICSHYPTCDAYVNCHRANEKFKLNGTEPLGRLADKTLRELKKVVHGRFDKIWKPKDDGGHRRMTRHQAYTKMSSVMGLSMELCHIGYFDEEQTRTLLQYLKDGWFV